MQKEFPNQSLSFLGEASTLDPSPSGRGQVRRDYCEGCHTALHTSYAVRVPSPSLLHGGRDYCEGWHIIRLRRKIKKLKHANMQKWAYNRHA